MYVRFVVGKEDGGVYPALMPPKTPKASTKSKQPNKKAPSKPQLKIVRNSTGSMVIIFLGVMFDLVKEAEWLFFGNFVVLPVAKSAAGGDKAHPSQSKHY